MPGAPVTKMSKPSRRPDATRSGRGSGPDAVTGGGGWAPTWSSIVVPERRRAPFPPPACPWSVLINLLPSSAGAIRSRVLEYGRDIPSHAPTERSAAGTRRRQRRPVPTSGRCANHSSAAPTDAPGPRAGTRVPPPDTPARLPCCGGSTLIPAAVAYLRGEVLHERLNNGGWAECLVVFAAVACGRLAQLALARKKINPLACVLVAAAISCAVYVTVTAATAISIPARAGCTPRPSPPPSCFWCPASR
jgi:hypothetical protein